MGRGNFDMLFVKRICWIFLLEVVDFEVGFFLLVNRINEDNLKVLVIIVVFLMMVIDFLNI